MKEHPIIFSTPMVKAIQEERKTMTRRVIKPQPQGAWIKEPIWVDSQGYYHAGGDHDSFLSSKSDLRCPYGEVGNKLWVKETWATEKHLENLSPSEIGCATEVALWYKSDIDQLSLLYRGKWRPSIFMPRSASRITLEITGIRIERLREITRADVEREGCSNAVNNPLFFPKLWDSLNVKRGYGWQTNPFVWVISFKVVDSLKTLPAIAVVDKRGG